ncbi:hypothetical protein A2U01_0085477, partial [Trifolium medium]|nr:hypothetical protein [Trifolium medium]
VTTPELQERRNKGLCFNCDDKYHPGHRCSKRQFLLLLADDDPAPTELLANQELLDPGPVGDVVVDSAPESDAEHFHLSTAALQGP